MNDKQALEYTLAQLISRGIITKSSFNGTDVYEINDLDISKESEDNNV